MFTAALFVIVKRSPSMHKALNKLWHFILMNISQRPKGKNMDAHNTEEYPISWELHRVKSKSRKVGKIVWSRSHDIPLGTIFYPRGRLAGAEEGGRGWQRREDSVCSYRTATRGPRWRWRFPCSDSIRVRVPVVTSCHSFLRGDRGGRGLAKGTQGTSALLSAAVRELAVTSK